MSVWGGPFLLMLGGIAALMFYLLRRGQRIGPAHLSDDDKQRAEALLRESN